MSSFNKLNGYEVEDSTARKGVSDLKTSLAAVNTNITNITENTNKNTEDIGKVNENIGKVNQEMSAVNEQIDNVEKVQNMLSNYNINLSNHIIYDFLQTKHNQGMCIDENNKMYIYLNTDNTVGDLLVFDLTTYELERTIEGLQLYHGGDMCVFNNVLYAIGNYVNKLIVKYELLTGVRSEINPFNGHTFDETLGIAKFDDNNLLCFVGNITDGTYTSDITATSIYKVNTTTLETEEIQITNTKNIYLDFYCFQSLEYFNGKLYLLTSYPNMIIELIYDAESNTFNINKLYNLPDYDILGQEIGETEGISKVWSNVFGKTSFMITTCLVDDNVKTLKAYVFDVESNVQNMLLEKDIANNHLERTTIKCDANINPGIYYENGSTNYPFKSLRRAIAYATNSPIRKGSQITLYAGEYRIGRITYAKANIIGTATKPGEIVVNGDITLSNCEMMLMGNNPYDEVVFKIMNVMNVDGGKCDVRGLVFEDTFSNKHCFTNIWKCTFNDVDRQSIISSHTNAVVKSAENTIKNQNYHYYVGDGSVLIVTGALDNSKILSYTDNKLVLKG